MKALDIMNKQVIKVKKEHSVGLAIEKIMEYGLSGLPIVNDKNEIVAYISDGDILRYIGRQKDIVFGTLFFPQIMKGDTDNLEARAKQLLDLNVMEIAQKKVYKISAEVEVGDIAAFLAEKNIHRIPVVKNGVLVGTISRADIIRNAFKYKVSSVI
ncbi:CBS domain-containing protein [Bacillus tuaregi]|uniref:CBS domain-containing protein n=1 Tax=Bacillus tuaregi TaxID=1816695 RepID=UPI0008F91A4E|nr:CBS domain-containing protein [Bacillus tuaregi]